MTDKCVLIDNYDSFTYNIVQYLKELGVNPRVFKNDEITVDELKNLDFSSIIISPGPKTPYEAGISLEVIGEFYRTKKILGVCLGHQCIAQYFGCNVVKAKEPMHGKVSEIYFEEDALFEGMKQGFEATRYHSLVVDNNSITPFIKPLAYAEGVKKQKRYGGIDVWRNGIARNAKPFTRSAVQPFTQATSHPSPVLMALKHRDYPTYGVQFHPEAILTQNGKKIFENFLDNNSARF
mgnify:CR=1 FL=1